MDPLDEKPYLLFYWMNEGAHGKLHIYTKVEMI